MHHLCVFCGSKAGNRPVYAQAARELGTLMAQRDCGLVYGGGSVGLMGVVADAVLDGGGTVHGVIPEFLATVELLHPKVDPMQVVPGMHARKARMAELCQGFAALPGGYGTFEELYEVIAWSQLGLHSKPIALLNTAGFFDSCVAMIDHAVSEGFIHADQRSLVIVCSEPAEVLDRCGL